MYLYIHLLIWIATMKCAIPKINSSAMQQLLRDAGKHVKSFQVSWYNKLPSLDKRMVRIWIDYEKGTGDAT